MEGGCQGVGVDGHGLVGGAWLMWLRLAGRSGRPRVRDGGHAHIRGLGTPRPLFVALPLSKVERGARLGVAQATDRGVGVREPGCSGRLASRNGKCRSVSPRVGEPPASRGCGRRCECGGDGGDLPAVGGEFAGDRDGDDPAGFVAGVFELAPAGVQPALRFPGDVDDLGCVSALAALERFADRGAAAVVPGCLDQQPAGVGGAGLGDRPEPALLTGGVL